MIKTRSRFPAKIGFAAALFSILISLSACEKSAYEKAEEKNTIEGFERFLKKYPEGEHSRTAMGHLAQLYFVKVTTENTIAGYEDYLQRFPTAITRGEIIERLASLTKAEIAALTIDQMAQMQGLIKTDLGDIKLRFFPQKAPETCRNFIKLAKIHFYDTSQFIVIVPGVFIQGGAPKGDPVAGPGYTIKAEFNDLKNIPGAVGMVRGENPDSAGSQFYICLKSLPDRDGKYTVFAQVEDGMDIAEAISSQESSGPEGAPYPFRPVKPIVIRAVEIVQEKQR